MSSLLIKNGNVVLSDKVQKTNIFVQDGIIKKIGVEALKADKIIDADGAFVLAGFVDMHTHLREPGFEYKEDIQTGSLAAVKGGYTTVCCMPNTKPVTDNAALVSYIVSRGAAAGKAKVLPIGAITKGSMGAELAELGLMSEAGAIAFSDDGKPVENGGMMKTALEYAKTRGLLIISHSEDKTLSGSGVVNEGYHATIAGLKGIPKSAEEAAIAREILLAKETGARIHIAHISTRGSVEIVRQAKAKGILVTAETCPHYFAATDKEILDYNTNAKINPPLREEADRLAIIEGLADGTIDAIATDHAPHHFDEKNLEYDYAPFGTTGLETAFALGYTYLVKTGKIDIIKLSRLMSAQPAKILGLKTGVITEGTLADLTVAHCGKEFTVDKNKMYSKSKNTLFDGWKLNGEILYTIVDGKIVKGADEDQGR